MKFKLHSPIILPRYKTADGVTVASDYPLQTFSSIAEHHAAFSESGNYQNRAADYQNCLYKCLLPADGAVIDHVSCTPLHVQSKPKQSQAKNAKAKARIRFV